MKRIFIPLHYLFALEADLECAQEAVNYATCLRHENDLLDVCKSGYRALFRFKQQLYN